MKIVRFPKIHFFILLLFFSPETFAQTNVYKRITGTWLFDHFVFGPNIPDTFKLREDAVGMRLMLREDDTFVSTRKANGIDEETSSGEYELSEDGKFLYQNNDSMRIVSVGMQLILTNDDITIYFNKDTRSISTSAKDSSIFSDTKSDSINQKAITLNDVLISNKSARTITLSDNKNRVRKHPSNLGFMAHHNEVAQRFVVPNTGSYYKLKSVKLPLMRSECWSDIIIHIYSANEKDLMPGKELGKMQTTFTKVDQKYHDLVTRWELFNILFNAGDQFYVSVETSDSITAPCLTGFMLKQTTVPNFLCRRLNIDNSWKTEQEMGFYQIGHHADNWHAQLFAEVKLEEYK